MTWKTGTTKTTETTEMTVRIEMTLSPEASLPLSTVAGLAQSVERLTAEREVAGSIPGAGPLLRVLK